MIGGSLLLGGCQSAPSTYTVGYVAPDSAGSAQTAASEAALQWLRDHDRFTVTRTSLAALADNPDQVDVAWVHVVDSTAHTAWPRRSAQANLLADYYEAGGKVLCTNYAAFLPAAAGIESNAPERRVIDVENREHNDKRGLQSFRGHPVFSRGLLGGAQLWDATEDHRLPRIGYFGDATPDEGRVAGVERARTAVLRPHKLLVEYEHDASTGHLLAAGAFTYLSRPNDLAMKLERFLGNALLYLANGLPADAAEAPTHWPYAENVPRSFEVSTDSVTRSAQRRLADLPRTGLNWSRSAPSDEFFDVAGRRAIVMGDENGGLHEVWTHPFKLLYDYETGIVTGDSVTWLDEVPLEVEARPASFVRRYDLPSGTLRQVIYPSMEASGAVVHYRADTDVPVRLVVRFRTDLKYMWPYPDNAMGNVHYGYDAPLGALHIRDSSGTFHGVMGGDIAADRHLAGPYGTVRWTPGGFTGTSTDRNQVYHAALYTLDAANDQTLTYAFAGSNTGRDQVLSDYRQLVETPRATYAQTVDHYDQLLRTSTQLDTPSERFDRLYRWALVGSDRFVIDTPHLGRGLMAGYGTSDPSGGTWASGTPGYAWYFGRDGVWSGLALSGYGDFASVKAQLKLLQDHQDLRGKILHALNTAGPGVQQYNAADSTPLYVILAAHYLRASGDQAFIQDSWPHIEQAMDFLYSTDTDGDGLIENTNVGHGWIEFGKLSGAHTTFYLAGLWAEALDGAARLAAATGRDSLQQRYAADAASVRETLNTDFWNADAQFYYQAKNPDGSYNAARTMMPSVPMHFGLLDPSKTDAMLDAFASNRFSADWGMRIVDQTSALYDADNYHLGTVWPLFTGWTALAEYRYGRPAAGYRHVMNNLLVKRHWAHGYIEEVLNGDTYTPNGFCPHQAWSETNALYPVLSGLVGWQPNALADSARLAPRLPAHWDSLSVQHLHAGDTAIDVQITRSSDRTRYVLTRRSGDPITVRLAPGLPPGMQVTGASVNGTSTPVATARTQGRLADPIPVTVRDSSVVELRHAGGIGAVPVVPTPEPGATSEGYRIVSTALDGSTYRLTVEGTTGTQHTFRVRSFGPAIEAVEGAALQSVSDRGLARLQVDFGAADYKDIARTTVTLTLDASNAGSATASAATP